MMLASLKPFCLYSFNVCCASAAVAKLDTIMKYFGFAVVASALFCAGTEAEDAGAVAGVVLRATVFSALGVSLPVSCLEVSVFGEPTFSTFTATGFKLFVSCLLPCITRCLFGFEQSFAVAVQPKWWPTIVSG